MSCRYRLQQPILIALINSAAAGAGSCLAEPVAENPSPNLLFAQRVACARDPRGNEPPRNLKAARRVVSAQVATSLFFLGLLSQRLLYGKKAAPAPPPSAAAASRASLRRRNVANDLVARIAGVRRFQAAAMLTASLAAAFLPELVNATGPHRMSRTLVWLAAISTGLVAVHLDGHAQRKLWGAAPGPRPLGGI